MSSMLGIGLYALLPWLTSCIRLYREGFAESEPIL